MPLPLQEPGVNAVVSVVDKNKEKSQTYPFLDLHYKADLKVIKEPDGSLATTTNDVVPNKVVYDVEDLVAVTPV